MRVKWTAALILVLAFTLYSVPVFAASDWDTFVAEMEKKEKIKDTGAAIVADMLDIAPGGTETELWQKLWNGEPRWRAAAAVALISRMFPDGDPSRWQEVSGFAPRQSVQPRQLIAMDAFFVAVDSLSRIPDGIWGSAYLLDLFGKSGMGKGTERSRLLHGPSWRLEHKEDTRQTSGTASLQGLHNEEFSRFQKHAVS